MSSIKTGHLGGQFGGAFVSVALLISNVTPSINAQTLNFNSFIGSITPLGNALKPVTYEYGVTSWTSTAPVPWGPEVGTAFFCANDNANGGSVVNNDGIWPLDAASNNDVTQYFAFITAGPALQAQLAIVGEPNPIFLVEYTDACVGTFTFASFPGTCCGDPTNVYYFYNFDAGTFTCSDNTTPVYPLCRSMLYTLP